MAREPGERTAADADLRVSADELTGVAGLLAVELERRGHQAVVHGALAQGEREDWAWASEATARDVAEGRAEQGDRVLLDGHRRVDRRQQGRRGEGRAVPSTPPVRRRAPLERRQRARAQPAGTSQAQLGEILDAWFAGQPSDESDDRANIEHLAEIERAARRAP